MSSKSRSTAATCAAAFCLSIAAALAQSPAPAPVSAGAVWADVADAAAVRAAALPATRWVSPDRYRLVTLDEARLQEALSVAPMETRSTDHAPAADTVSLLQQGADIRLPLPDGGWARFRFIESPVMAPALAAKYPMIRTFLGQGLDDPSATVRFDHTPTGFHAQILSPKGAFYIDPYLRDDATLHVSYYKRDYRSSGKPFACLVESNGVAGGDTTQMVTAATAVGETLRTYRLAVAATGEYTQFHGGTVAAGLAAVVTAINRVDGVYEVELAVRMVLVPNNDVLIFTNPNTDPYSNFNGFSMLGQNQAAIDARIGRPNYDVGHVFSTGGGGVAGLGVVCSNSNKARGVTGLSFPLGDPFTIDYVAHEMGHQFGGNHSFNGVNGSCAGGNRNGFTAYEPGSGSTIQAYAGICGADNLQPNSDPYFHSISFDEMRAFVTGFANACAVTTSTGNNAPTVSAGPDLTIPAATPFVLTASGADVNGDSLTYGWEERDLGPAVSLSAPDNGFSPLFRSFNPTSDASRTFPRLADILADVSSNAEKLPQTSRKLDFRVTARDNRAGGGGVAWDQRRLTVDASRGPFRVTLPDGNTFLEGDVTVAWDVAGTDLAPIGVTSVNILLSTDGGLTFPITLAASTPNDGTEIVTIPAGDTLTARIKVEAVDNVFFALSGNSVVGSCLLSLPPQPDVIQSKNRYLSFSAGTPGANQAVRVRFVSLPGAFATLNGTDMWLAGAIAVGENPGRVNPIPGQPTFMAATLQCQPFYADWGTLGVVHVSHPAIVPGGVYDVQLIRENCPVIESSFSASLRVPTSAWGDVAGSFDAQAHQWTAPDGLVEIVADAVAILDKFSGRANSPSKTRVDIDPDVPDRLITISDVTRSVDAFRGRPYPFDPPPAPCAP
ncbi:MAG: reprolysin-like metallopeptidase [Phycisphaerae bacterium]